MDLKIYAHIIVKTFSFCLKFFYFSSRQVSCGCACVLHLKSGYTLQRFLRMCSYCGGYLYVVIQCNGHGTIKGCLWLLGRQSGASIVACSTLQNKTTFKGSKCIFVNRNKMWAKCKKAPLWRRSFNLI